MTHPIAPRRPQARSLKASVLGLSLLLTLTLVSARSGAAQAPPHQIAFAAEQPAAVAVPTLALADCIDMAMQRQPRLAAQRASLAASEDGKRGLDALLVPGLLAPEVPIRRRQATLGLTAAAAGLDQVERETVYAVTRTYYSVVFAREQEKVAKGVVDRLTATFEAAERQLKAGARDVSATDVSRTAVYLRLAKTKQIEAEQGVKRAMSGLKEAIGLEPACRLEVPLVKLAPSDARPSREDVIAYALARRGELIRVAMFAEVTCLEVQAQGTSIHKRMETFAAGSDIHADQVPQGLRNGEYRPGAVPPEYPTLLAGPRPDRIKHAQSLNARANAVVETTRNLISLEADNAYLRWEETTRQLIEARDAADIGDKLADDLNKDFTSGLKVKVEDVVNVRVLAATARSQYNEYVFKQILALADLERVTAGGFCPGLAAPLVVRPAAKD